MRFGIIVLLSCISFISRGLDLDLNKADSIYSALTSTEKFNQLVWLKVSNDADLSKLHPPTLETFGGIYLDRPFQAFDEYLFNRNSIPSLAVQLDERLNPAPEDLTNLPSLITLSSLRDIELLHKYLDYLKSIAASYGINYLVLPAIDETSLLMQHLIGKIEAYDPVFFVNHNRVEFQELSKKKEFTHLFDYADFWVVSSENFPDANKAISRHSKRMDFTPVRNTITHSIANQYSSPPTILRRKLPNKLAVEIGRASIVPLQRTAGILPLKTDTICLITENPLGELSEMLGKYAYLITSEPNIKHSHAPVIIDNAYVDLDEYGVTNRKKVFLGDFNSGLRYGSSLDGALFTSIDNEMYSYLLPQLLFGVADASGLMPVETTDFKGYSNEPILGLGLLGYAPSEISGLDETAKQKINEIIQEAIKTGSTPGCQVAVVVGGSIVLEEGFGFLTYDSLIKVERNTLYDIASVTKVTATLLAVMKLYEDGALSLDASIANYLPKYDSSNKASITIRQLLSHNAGLVSYVPFWKRALGGDRLESFYYETEDDEKNDNRSYGMRPGPILIDSLNNWIVGSPILNYDSFPGYQYSDIGFMILHQIVEKVSGQPLDQFLEANFYSRLALNHLRFNPLEKGAALSEIAPTEYDDYYRNEQVWGKVHDRNAAVFGGVAGHAGLFSNSRDLLVLLQMIAQNGEYGGQRYLQPSTIAYFNQQYYPDNRRGLGWDKKSETVNNVSKKVSNRSFGHSGFTGTLVWVDPEFDLVFVFLSNRIYPDANNTKLIQKDIRTRVQDVVYDAVSSKWIN